MKKIISALVVTALLAGCAANGPQRGYYDEDGNYHPSQQAVNADRAQTGAAIGLGVLAAGALAVGIKAQHDANKNKHHNDGDHWSDKYGREHTRRGPYDYHPWDRAQRRDSAPMGSHGHPIRYQQRNW